MRKNWIFTLLISLFVFTGCMQEPLQSQPQLVVSHLYSVTQPEVFVAFSKGYFANKLGSEVEIDRRTYPNGTDMMAAFRNEEIDIAYVGSVPALISFAEKPNFKIVAGTNIGGTLLVVRGDIGIRSVSDLKGKTIAVPALGNFQDIALRSSILVKAGLEASAEPDPDKVTVVTSKPAEMLARLQEGSVDGVLIWEPWASRILQAPNANTKILVNWTEVWRDGQYPSSVLIAHADFIKEHPGLLEQFLAAHVEGAIFAQQNPEETTKIIHDQILELRGTELPQEIIDSAWEHVGVTYDPSVEAVLEFARLAHDAYPDRLVAPPDPDEIFDLSFLNRVLAEKGLPEIVY